MKIKDLPLLERPRERAKMVGVENISNEELLAILIKNGTRDYSVKEIACDILKRIEKIENLENMHLGILKDIKGLGDTKKIELLAAIELGRRIYLQKSFGVKEVFDNPLIIYQNNKYLFVGKKQEYFYSLYLDSKNKLIERKLLFMGTLNRSIVHPREIFKEAYLVSASKIICLHNHPSGDISPSDEDIFLTKNLVKIGKIQGINLVDHLIISDVGYYSFYDNNRDLFL